MANNLAIGDPRDTINNWKKLGFNDPKCHLFPFLEVFQSNSSNYTKDVVVFFDGLYKYVEQFVREKKLKHIEK